MYGKIEMKKMKLIQWLLTSNSCILFQGLVHV
jgi:hypothetical protein